MPYTKQTWATGDVVTQEKMNHIEDGIANAFLEPEPIAYDDITVLDVILPETSINATNYTGSYYTISDIPLNSDPVHYGTYRVTYDGTEYILKDYSNAYYDIYIGFPEFFSVNYPLAYDVTDDRFEVPFSLTLYPSDGEYGPSVYLKTSVTGSHTYKIELIEEEIKAVSPRLISQPYFYLTFGLSDSEHYKTVGLYDVYKEVDGKTYTDLQKALARGQNIVIKNINDPANVRYYYISRSYFSYGVPNIIVSNSEQITGIIRYMNTYTVNIDYLGYLLDCAHPEIKPDGTITNDPDSSSLADTPYGLRTLTFVTRTEYQSN